MAGMESNLAEMAKAGGHVLEVNQGIQGDLKTLYGQLAPLQGAWKGQASVSFHQLLEQWQGAASKLNSALEGIGDTLGSNRATYQATDESEQSSFSSIQSALG